MRTIFMRSPVIVVRTLLSHISRCLVLCLLCALIFFSAPSCSRHLSVSLKGEQVEFNLSENDSLQYNGRIFGKAE